MATFKSCIQWLNRCGAAIGVVSIFAMMVLITIELVSRKVFHFSTLISDEISGYLLVLVTYMGLSYTMKEGGHIQVTIITDHLPPRILRPLKVGWYLLGMGYSSLLAYRTWCMTYQSYSNGTNASTILGTPLFLPQAFMALGLSLLTIQMVMEAITNVNNLRVLKK